MSWFSKLISIFKPKPKQPVDIGIDADIKKPEPAQAPAPAPQPIVKAPLWLEIARKEIGTKEVGGTKHNPRILEYHKATKLKAGSDETAWCSSFANWCLREAGIKGTESAWARDWLNWGYPVKKPIEGCIAVYERNGPGGDSHVCFWTGEKGGYDMGLGGNQSNQVSIAPQPKAKLLGYRWPKGV